MQSGNDGAGNDESLGLGAVVRSSEPMPLKTRDKIKYVCASLLAAATVVSIVALQIAKSRNRRQNVEQAATIQRTLETFGQQDRPANPRTSPAQQQP